MTNVCFETEAMVMRDNGGPDVLELRTIGLPWDPDGDAVRVRLEAAGINPADTFFRAFGPYLGEGPGTVLGHDGAGIVEAVGARVQGLQTGDRVCFCNGGLGGEPGTYARHAVVPEWLAARVPDGIDSVTAASLPLVFITAWEALVERAGLEADEAVLIHAGAGGTGQMAIQVARELGARIATTVSSAEKAVIVGALGAELAIDYRQEDFVEACLEWTRDAGLQVALDNVGADTFQRTLSALAPYGRLVTLMGMPGDLADETAYNRNLTVHNVMMLTPMWLGLDAERRRQGQLVRQAVDWLRQERISACVTETFALERVGAAHARLEQGGLAGKIVLSID